MAGVSAFGTTLKMGGTAGTAVANVTNIEGPGWSTEFLDTTAHDSSGAYREIVPSFIDAGEVTVTINYDPNSATHKNVVGGYQQTQRTKITYAIGWPTTPASGFTFAAYVTGFQPSSPHDGKLEASVTLKIDGAVTAY